MLIADLEKEKEMVVDSRSVFLFQLADVCALQMSTFEENSIDFCVIYFFTPAWRYNNVIFFFPKFGGDASICV